MLPLILLSQIALSIAASECDIDKVAIAGGNYTLTDGANVGSKVDYTCPEGMYPHPLYLRECLSDGKWTNEKVKAQCRAVQCPTPVTFESGEYYPRKGRYFVGDTLHFECWGGFQMYGPENRTCQANGKWSGEETKCDDKEGDCPNPGIPIGATKVGIAYKIENKVTYECQRGLSMFGSRERVCMETKRWSGAEPTCRYWYTFDTPNEVAETFSASLSEAVESSDLDKVEEQTDRKIQVKTAGLMNIFIVIDASKSVGEDNFKTAKAACEVFIEKMSSYDFVPRYAVISYASFAKTIVELSNDDSTDPNAVIESIKNFEYSAHEDKQGTNTRGALHEVHNMLSLRNEKDKRFMETKNVILLMTDGMHNMGGDPAVEMKRIREILDIRPDTKREDFLDVYVFGLGKDTSESEINDLASKKDNEKHVFKMENVDFMKKAFDEMLDEVEAFQMCGLTENQKNGEVLYPWIAKISITRAGTEETCKGSIVSKYFILTAAHCFHLHEPLHTINIDIGGKGYKAKDLYRHSKYDPVGKQDKKVEKSFDYDLALIRVEMEIKFSSSVRPICLPCTTGTSWALKQRGTSVTCSDHEKIILSSELVKAMFIAEEKPKQFQPMNVLIKRGSKRLACLKDVKESQDKFKEIPDIRDAVTDNFLCTGGIEPQVDPQTCKGDSGGPLIVPYKQRFIQVGVISWGNINSCSKSARPTDKTVPDKSRDFHTDLFHMLDWLKKTLEFEVEFLK